MKKYIGVDIGGTKCSCVTATINKDGVVITNKKDIQTRIEHNPYKMIDILSSLIEEMISENGDIIKDYRSIGVSCGNPLDTKNGIILSPPNLPGWDNVHITEILKDKFGLDCYLLNDANACAIAEWKFGNGKGYNNVVFLTFGTGMGAGLILDGKLYEGTCGNAGEIGHIRLTNNGPIGYHKKGSFEGYCSGGGITRLCEDYIQRLSNRYKDSKLLSCKEIDTKTIFEYAYEGDLLAKKVIKDSSKKLGIALSYIIDILNPEAIIIGSIYTRNEEMLYKEIKSILKKESLSDSLECCKILKSGLGESLGDVASIAIAYLKSEV